MSTEDATKSQGEGKRARNRRAIEADILRVARQHLAEHGAASLSLRAIARDLGMVSSGIYRYVDSRDELLTRLIVESYTALAAHVRRAHALVPASDLEGRWACVGFALREWAREHPHDWALLYGSPVPGYAAPAERTTEPGSEVLLLTVDILDDARAAGRLVDAPLDEEWSRRAVDAAGAFLATPPLDSTDLSAQALTRGIAAWLLLIGSVTNELFEQLGELPDAEALFGCLVELARSLVLTAS